MYSGITSGRVLDGEILYAKILEVNLFASLTHCFIEISPHSTGHFECKMSRRVRRNLYETVCRQMQTN